MALTWSKIRHLRRCISTSCKLVAPRINSVNIQLLPDMLHKQVFGPPPEEESSDDDHGSKQMKKIKEHLKGHDLWGRPTTIEEEVEFKLPPFEGQNIEDHFKNLATNQIKDYVRFIERFVQTKLPRQPTEWKFASGWTKYDAEGVPTSVDCPEDDIYVFDVETVVTEGSYPCIAVALSENSWYSWCSSILVEETYRWSHDVRIDDLIPLESPKNRRDGLKRPKVAIGHNVAFDRSFVKEQYFIEKSKLRFMDTMSLHIAVCGLTSFQRVLYNANKKKSKLKAVDEFKEKQRQRGIVPIDDWMDFSTLNNLKDVHQLHVGGEPLDKDPRNLFVEGSSQDVRDNFQECARYAASDVLATYEVFQSLWPQFQERFPHPVTMAGMFEMGTGYLPVNENWERYIHHANTVYDDMLHELKEILMKLANEACEYLQNERYRDDPWLWDLDWSLKPLGIKKSKPVKKKKKGDTNIPEETVEENESCIEEVLKAQENHYKTAGSLIGYPKWYRDLTEKPSSEDWQPGPSKISSLMRVTPKLLRLTWDGFPVHYDDKHAWGYLVPGRKDNLDLLTQNTDVKDGTPLPAIFPYKQMCDILERQSDTVETMSDEAFEEFMNKQLNFDDMSSIDHGKWDDKVDYSLPPKRKKETIECPHKGDGPHLDVKIPGCWFFKIPHKNTVHLVLSDHPKDEYNAVYKTGGSLIREDGQDKRVGNPLTKDYIERFKDGILKAMSGDKAEYVLKIHSYSSYWKNAQNRIMSQMNIWLNEEDIPDLVKKQPGYTEGKNLGAIVPRIVTAGTVTRRAVEATWLTASNAYGDRIGSELKAMIQAPPGYSFVGADVDSQELWIGALLGDANFGQTHGCTGLGWMTLQGNKKDKTDLHSKVAETVNISRDQAKVFNYGRIYGAGQRFAEKLLLQYNHQLTKLEAKQKAQLMYHTTKGKKKLGKWSGGSESAMFNKLEEIAREGVPVTPVLGCKISKALEPVNVDSEFMTSRINWVVQSSAVDYLHLMLVCMNWLFEQYDINGRFCISIHDEVRYFVASEDRYRAALALQITNLLTRSMFSYKLGIKDLPLSVAFFSAVDIDSCLRKEVNLSCKTPSNPFGLERGYQIPPGEAMDIREILEMTGGSLHKQELKTVDVHKDIDEPIKHEQSDRQNRITISHQS